MLRLIRIFVFLQLFSVQGIAMTNAVRISMVYDKTRFSVNDFDPVKINYITEWNIVMNLYSRLVAFNTDGDLVSGLARKFYWVGDDAHFEIRPNFKTVDGIKITPEDVAYSLKRLLILSGNTHGKLDDFICDAAKLKTIEDTCSGIRYDDNELILKTTKQNSFLFKTLTTADFSVIPKKSIDFKTLKITDYRNTTGLYYFDRYTDVVNMVFKINPNHWLYSAKLPQEVEIIPDFYGRSASEPSVGDKMLQDRLDIISKSNAMKISDFQQLGQALKEKNIPHDLAISKPIFLYYFSFTPRGFALKPELRYSPVTCQKQGIALFHEL